MKITKTEYSSVVEHYESCFKKYGDTTQGVDWPNQEDLNTRFKVMLELAKNDENFSLLDFGCGSGLLLKYIKSNRVNTRIDYTGLDLSELFISHCKKQYPEYNFISADILTHQQDIGLFDYLIMNGVFTEKINLQHQEMFNYFKKMIKKTFTLCNKGIAFNVMSKQVDWERDDLFHLSLDELAAFLSDSVSRNFIIRNDYGLWEYTVYVYK
jgi:2-polyprenyl-3-methyl-5-hydroxy-6-metoxy-1,4-benzoquinol methylase